jgi:hypothetical protein
VLNRNAPIAVEADMAIADGPVKMHRAWPGLTTTTDGDLILAYKESKDHHRTDDAVLLVARSHDGGRSWPDKQVIAAEPGWRSYTNHSLTRLSDGSLRLNLIRGQQRVRADGTRYAYGRSAYLRSDDGGRTWQERGADLDVSYVDPAQWSMAYGRCLELSDGRLMVTVYGVPPRVDDPKLRVLGIAFSEDGGRTWPESRVIYEDRSGNICPSETDIIRLADGRILALIRANTAKRLFRTYSADEGRSWSPIEPTEMPGQCPCVIHLASGALLCAYRDMRPEQPGMSCAISEDLGQSWQPIGYLYKGDNFDCAYPTMATLPDGRIYCAYYTAATPHAITGTCDIRGLILRDNTQA